MKKKEIRRSLGEDQLPFENDDRRSYTLSYVRDTVESDYSSILSSVIDFFNIDGEKSKVIERKKTPFLFGAFKENSLFEGM